MCLLLLSGRFIQQSSCETANNKATQKGRDGATVDEARQRKEWRRVNSKGGCARKKGISQYSVVNKLGSYKLVRLITFILTWIPQSGRTVAQVLLGHIT